MTGHEYANALYLCCNRLICKEYIGFRKYQVSSKPLAVSETQSCIAQTMPLPYEANLYQHTA